MSSGIFNRHTGYHNRRSIRLQGFDYSKAGYYFVTVCIHDRGKMLFGDVVNGKMEMNDAGKTAQRCWEEIPVHYQYVTLDEFQIMPNHVHGIIVIHDDENDTPNGPMVGVQYLEPLPHDFEPLPRRPHRHSHARHNAKNQYQHIIPGSIGSIVRGFKIGVTKWFRTADPYLDVWQRNYYDHIIRDENSLRRIRKYIRDNPKKWVMDGETHLPGEINEIKRWQRDGMS